MKITWPAVLTVGAAGLLLGFVGFMREYPPADGRLVLGVLDNAWRALALLVMETDASADQNWQVVVARLLVPAATLGGIYRLSAGYVARRTNAWRLSRLSGHTVVVGLGEHGRGFLRSCQGPVAVLDRAEVVLPERRPGDQTLRHSGDGRDAEALRLVGAARARTVVIATGDDTVNLEILDRVVACRRQSREPFQAVVRIGSAVLARQLEREDGFVRRGSGDGPPADEAEALIEVVPFTADRVAAQQFLADHPLVDLAELRAHPRVHLVVVGWTGFALSLLEQLVRLAPYRTFGVPRVDLMTHQPDEVRAELAAVQPALLGATGAGDLMELHLHPLEGPEGLPTPGQMEAIEPGPVATVTAVVVGLESDETSAAAAMTLRDRANIEGRWRGPVFVRLATTSALTRLLAQRAAHAESVDRIVPGGTIAATCRVDAVLGERERAARTLHQAYLETRRSERGGAGGRGPSDKPWPLLDQTYRAANRRAIDHLPIKLLSAGYLVMGRPLHTAPGSRLDATPEELETLAELEHRSWEIDRLLDGWRPGPVRDTRRRLHEAIGIPYLELDEVLGRPVRQYDRDQILVLSRMLEPGDGPVTVRRELRVGLSPRDEASPAAFEASVRALVERDRDAVISVFVIPSTEVEASRAGHVMAVLGQEGAVYRLVVVLPMPIEAFPEAVRSRLEPYLNTGRAVMADLVPVGTSLADWRDPGVRSAALRGAEEYVASRCDVMLG